MKRLRERICIFERTFKKILDPAAGEALLQNGHDST